MRIADLNWMQVEEYLQRDDRVVVPLGSVEQHAYLSLAVDAILSERVAVDAAEPLGVPVFPVMAYGLTPYFSAYPGTVTLRPATYRRFIHDVLDSLNDTGFRRILFVNGHGGNTPAEDMAGDWARAHPDVRVRFHHWWRAPATMAHARSLQRVASHASWMENFPWTRLAGVTLPDEPKPEVDTSGLHEMDPADVRGMLGDGSFGGAYQLPDADMLAFWKIAVQETRERLDGYWG